MKKNTYIKLATAASIALLATSAHATLKTDKVTLKGNMVVEYNKLPAPVETITEAFSEGMFYGRLRANAFLWDWKDEDYQTGGKKMDNKANGYGGSLIYKSAPLYGVSGTLGLYTSQNAPWWREDVADVGYVKAGKDTFSRRDTKLTGNWGMTVVGQAFLQYDFAKTSVVAGRQMFETVFTASNDTKMIPNTFDGVTATIKDVPQTTIQLGYLAKQKLRDHTVAHDVIAFDAADSWNENDDAAVNKNLTVDRIGNDNKLLIGSVTNKSIKNLKANVSFAAVPDVLNNLVLEAHYTIPVGGDWQIVPGVRYMQQFDALGADYGVANLAKNQTGYTDPNSLDTNMIAARLDIKDKAFLGRLGYSKIADEADIVTPWRGFPTGGFTRAMAQYNWFANTTTYMVRAGYDFGKADMVPGFSIMGRYAVQDFDDTKPGTPADSNVIHVDARQNIGSNLEAKLRLGFVDANPGDSGKTDTSYNEYRVELNYFF